MNATSSFGMLKYQGGGGWPRACDACHAAASAVYCRADEAYLCAGCDARVHHANRVASRHERVRVCDACERAPAALTCCADAAELCAACDADVHSANPLARRHQRVPTSCIGAGRGGLLPGPFAAAETPAAAEEVEDNSEDEAASWLLINENCNQINQEGFFGDDQVDEYLDIVGYNACKEIQTQEQQQNYGKNEGNECVVPSQCQQLQQQQGSYGVEMEYEVSNAAASLTQPESFCKLVDIQSEAWVPYTSMDASIVPDATMEDLSNPHFAISKGGAVVDLFAGARTLQMLSQFPMDREAKVLRYREKRKARRFEKTIRYASRKAYAETRPRIKGRFAKRTDVQQEMNDMFSSSVPSEGSYGIVP